MVAFLQRLLHKTKEALKYTKTESAENPKETYT